MDDTIYIRTQFGCAVVGRMRRKADETLVWERAVNNAELAMEAIAAIAEQGGIRWVDGEYTCPPALAARAQWIAASASAS